MKASQARIMGKTPHTPLFWAFLKSLFCPINASPNKFLVRTPWTSPLKSIFFRF